MAIHKAMNTFNKCAMRLSQTSIKNIPWISCNGAQRICGILQEHYKDHPGHKIYAEHLRKLEIEKKIIKKLSECW